MNMVAVAPSTPSCSDPAIGCPPINLLSLICCTMGCFTLPASVTTPRGDFSSASSTSGATVLTGVAIKVISASESHPVASMASSSNARFRCVGFRSTPLTCQPFSRKASPIDPPMRPTPTTVARRLIRRYTLDG